MDGTPEIENGLALLSQMRRKNENAAAAPYGAGRFSAVLPKMQIYLRDLLQKRKNRRNQNARRLDAVQTEHSFVLRLFFCWKRKKNGTGRFSQWK